MYVMKHTMLVLFLVAHMHGARHRRIRVYTCGLSLGSQLNRVTIMQAGMCIKEGHGHKRISLVWLAYLAFTQATRVQTPDAEQL